VKVTIFGTPNWHEKNQNGGSAGVFCVILRFTNFLEGISRQSLKNLRKIDQISGKKYMDLSL
jgi:hypothetical protein